jgi:redox-sensitive bicupin YhaK (pirin superfamily)
MEIQVAAETCGAIGAAQKRLEAYPSKQTALGSLKVSRVLPVRDHRMIGPWCFLDRFGPLSFTGGSPMDVAPHPHIGLQTVTWLLEGEVQHDDSLRCEAIARPGVVNVMTAGRGIAHAEQTPVKHTGRLNGVQLWVALPDRDREMYPAFQQVAEIPLVELRGGRVEVFAGAFGGASSAARHFSPILGADLRVHPRESLTIPLQEKWEHALLLLQGDCTIDGQNLAEGVLYYLGTERYEARFNSREGGRLLLIGGPPFPVKILMWWNFVARTPEEIAAARADWEAHRRFGDVPSYVGARLTAPELMRLARPNPLS